MWVQGRYLETVRDLAVVKGGGGGVKSRWVEFI